MVKNGFIADITQQPLVNKTALLLDNKDFTKQFSVVKIS
jgi:hypothetical protein